MGQVLKDWKAILLFVGPAFLLFVSIVFVPIIWSVGYTFFSGSPISGFEFSGFKNYLSLLDDSDFLTSLWFSTKYAVIVSIGQVTFGLLLALIYTFYLKRSSALVRTIVFFPVVLPTVAVSQMFVKIFEMVPQYGLLNSILALLNLNEYIQPWLGDPTTAFWVIAFMDIWKAIGFYAVLLYAGLVEIPTDLIEAGKIDGASGFQLLRRIVLPLLMPLIISSLIFSLNGTIKVFDSIVALTNGGPGTSTMPLTLYMFKTSFNYNEYGYGSTIALVLTLQSLLVTLLVYQFSKNRREGA